MDFADLALSPCIAAMGEDYEFTYAATDETVTIRGIFSEAYNEIDSATGLPISSSRPNLGVLLSDFDTEPLKGDTIAINSKTYRVGEIERDGEGGAVLILYRIESGD